MDGVYGIMNANIEQFENSNKLDTSLLILYRQNQAYREINQLHLRLAFTAELQRPEIPNLY